MKTITTILTTFLITTSLGHAALALDPPPMPSMPSLPALPSAPSMPSSSSSMSELKVPPLPGSSSATTTTTTTTTTTSAPKTTAAAASQKLEPLPQPPSPFANAPLFPDKAKNNATTNDFPEPPPLPMLNDTSPKTTKSADNEKTTETKITVVESSHHKHHTKQSTQVTRNLHPDYYISEPLPEAIYRKSYDRFNRHLPVAYYERDYDKLVFTTAAHDDLNGLRSLLDNGRNVELVDTAGDTPLLVAVKNNAINTARLLLARRANPEVMDRNGLTPLQIAVRMRNYPMQRALEEMGAGQMQMSNAQYYPAY